MVSSRLRALWLFFRTKCLLAEAFFNFRGLEQTAPGNWVTHLSCPLLQQGEGLEASLGGTLRGLDQA